LEVHGPGEADTNLYAYVSGHALKNTDPLGLEEDSENLVSFESNQSLPSGEVGDQAGNQTHSEGTPVAQTPGRSAPEMAPPANSPVLGPAKKTDAQLEVERTDDVDRGLDAVASDPLMLPIVALVRAGRTLLASDETRDFLGEDGRVITRTVPADPAEKATALAELTGGVVAGKLLRPVTRGKGPSAGPGGKQGGAGSGLAARGAGALSKAGQVLDRGGLTKAGRALEKHGGRTGSVFPQATGNVAAKNTQGQVALDDILGNVSKTSPNKFGGHDYFGGSRGGGARFDADGNFTGFLEP
jgi:hypothetical protein